MERMEQSSFSKRGGGVVHGASMWPACGIWPAVSETLFSWAQLPRCTDVLWQGVARTPTQATVMALHRCQKWDARLKWDWATPRYLCELTYWGWFPVRNRSETRGLKALVWNKIQTDLTPFHGQYHIYICLTHLQQCLHSLAGYC